MPLSDFYPELKGWVPAQSNPTTDNSQPQVPNQETEVTPYLRTTLPLPLQYTGDTVKQYNRPGLSRIRIAPLPPSGVAAGNAAIDSVLSNFQSTSITNNVENPYVPIINLNKQTGTSYTVQLSDRDTLISMTNNFGGVVILPSSTGAFQYVQSAQSAGAGGVSTGAIVTTVDMTNFAGDTLLLTSFVNPNVPFIAQTVTDTQGNVWTSLMSTSANGEVQTLWVAYNVKGGSNTIYIQQTWTPPTPPPVQYPFWLTAVVDEFGGILTNGLDQIAQGLQSAHITPTVTPSVAYCAMRDSITSPAVLTPPSGWVNLPFSENAWDYPAYDGGGPGGYISGIDEYYINPPVGLLFTGTATGGFASSSDCIVANFKTNTIPGIIFPYGWYCYIENVSTGIFDVQSLDPIDGVVQSITLAPNTGLLVVADGLGGWWTDRGVGTGGTNIVTSLQSLTGAIDLTSTGSTIAISVVGQNINLETVSSGGNLQTIWNWPKGSGAAVAINPTNSIVMNFSANQVKFMYIHIDVPITVGNFTWAVGATDATHHYDWGMYNLSGTLIWNIGPTIFGTAGQITTPFVQGSITIQPGDYWLAFTGNGTGVTTGGFSMETATEYFWYLNSSTSTPAWWTSSTSSTGGSLTGLSPTLPSAPTTATNLTSLTKNTAVSNTGIFPLIALSS